MSTFLQFSLKPKVATQCGTNFGIAKFCAQPLINKWLLSRGIISMAMNPQHDLVEVDFIASAPPLVSM